MTTQPKPNLAQALNRGIELLKVVAASPHPLAAAALAEQTGIPRTMTYRLLHTLQHHDLVQQTADGRYEVGTGLAPLAAATQRSLRQVAAAPLRGLADDTGLTAFLAMQDADECVTLFSATPSGFAPALVQEPGTRHPLWSGAPGKAILSIMPQRNWPQNVGTKDLEAEVDEVWRKGYASSHDEVLPGVSALAVPLQIPGERPCAVALLYTDSSLDRAALRDNLSRAVTAIEAGI